MLAPIRHRWSALFLLLLSVVLSAKGDDTSDKSADRAATLARLTKIVEGYSISMGDERIERLELVKSPLLHYSDQISPVTDGLVFAWTKSGRPEAVMALHPGTQGHTFIEFKSLSLSPLTATRQGRVEWTPPRPAWIFNRFKTRPPPSLPTASG